MPGMPVRFTTLGMPEICNSEGCFSNEKGKKVVRRDNLVGEAYFSKMFGNLFVETHFSKLHHVCMLGEAQNYVKFCIQAKHEPNNLKLPIFLGFFGLSLFISNFWRHFY